MIRPGGAASVGYSSADGRRSRAQTAAEHSLGLFSARHISNPRFIKAAQTSDLPIGNISRSVFFACRRSSSKPIRRAASSVSASRATTSKVRIIIWLTAFWIVKAMQGSTPFFLNKARMLSACAWLSSISRIRFPEMTLLVISSPFYGKWMYYTLLNYV